MKTLAIFALAFACTAHAEVYKCKNDAGKVEYQETPCANGAGDKIRIIKSSPADTGYDDISPELMAKYENLVSVQKVAVGMPAKMIIRSWGKPDKVNASTGSYGKHEQWVYETGRFTADYIYVDDGRLSSMQTSR